MQLGDGVLECGATIAKAYGLDAATRPDYQIIFQTLPQGHSRQRRRAAGGLGGSGVGVPSVDSGLDFGAGSGFEQGQEDVFAFRVAARVVDDEFAEVIDRPLLRVAPTKPDRDVRA